MGPRLLPSRKPAKVAIERLSFRLGEANQHVPAVVAQRAHENYPGPRPPRRKRPGWAPTPLPSPPALAPDAVGASLEHVSELAALLIASKGPAVDCLQAKRPLFPVHGFGAFEPVVTNLEFEIALDILRRAASERDLKLEEGSA